VICLTTSLKRNQTVGADSSFVLRLLIGDPPKQADKAVAILDELKSKGQQIAVSDLVVAEAYFALQHHYEVPKAEALAALRGFLESSDTIALGVAGKMISEKKLSAANPGFVDRMVHGEYFESCGGMLSFEKAAKKLPGVEVL